MTPSASDPTPLPLTPVPLPQRPAYQALQAHQKIASGWTLRELFAADACHSSRFTRYSLEAAGLFLDYSKNRIDDTTLRLLLQLARESHLEAHRDAMFAGACINTTEQRAVLHTALRAAPDALIAVNGQNVVPEVQAVLDRVRDFSERVRNAAWLGCTGLPITDVVNIGIGGSDLGPVMVCKAMRAFAHPRLSMHFVSNVDGHDLDAVLTRLNPETTLFIVASKTFTTMETMMNAHSARAWFLQRHATSDLPRHFVAVSTNTSAVRDFGIDTDNMFPFWDWVGGRYSVWSAIGLPVTLAIGFGAFAQFLAGARAMDTHFRTAPLERNMPVLLGLLSIWYRNFFGSTSISIAPYHQDLSRFPAYLQQLVMESNGKQVQRDGSPVACATSPVIWGDVGTNGQHAYFQLLHQGTDLVPVDFITALKAHHELHGHHTVLLANCLAQAEALMRGKTSDEVRAEMREQGVPEDKIAALAPHRSFPGNRPSNMILMDSLNPGSLGALIALYEHKTFTEGAIWGINSFDQWGVELGKVLAKQVEAELVGTPQPEKHDSSTNGLITRIRNTIS